MNYLSNDITTLEDLLNTLQSFQVVPVTSSYFKEEDVPTYQAQHYSPNWTEIEAKKASHIVTYKDSVIRGVLLTTFEIKPVDNLFWTGIRISHTRNVPAKFRIIYISEANMKYELYGWQQINRSEWAYLPSVIPGLDTGDDRILIEVEIPKESERDVSECFVNVRVAGFEGLLDSELQYLLMSQNGQSEIAVFNVFDDDPMCADFYHTAVRPMPSKNPNYRILPQSYSQRGLRL